MNVLARPPAVAGLFYPADRAELRAAVDGYLARAGAPGRVGQRVRAPKAIVVPHAGYIYSAPVAAYAYAAVTSRREQLRRVVLLGPAHHARVRSMATTSADVLVSPLGAVPVDAAGRDALLALGTVEIDDFAHAPEHSLEVQLPFLQRILDTDFTVLPVLVGGASPEVVADALDRVWGGDETLVVVSTDLSHYLDHASASALDQRTADAITRREWRAVRATDACGAAPLRGLLIAAERHGLTVEQLALCNSGDTAGSRDRVVGYGAFALS